MSSHECTAEVARVMRLYVGLGVFRIGSCLAAQLAAINDGRSLQPELSSAIKIDRPLQLWRATVAAKLGRMKRACGPCLPKRIGCEHHDTLIDRAEVVEQKIEVSEVAEQAGRFLGSRRWTARASPAAISFAESARATANAQAAVLESKRKAIDASDTYRDAVELFVLACGPDLGYCLRRNE